MEMFSSAHKKPNYKQFKTGDCYSSGQLNYELENKDLNYCFYFYFYRIPWTIEHNHYSRIFKAIDLLRPSQQISTNRNEPGWVPQLVWVKKKRSSILGCILASSNEVALCNSLPFLLNSGRKFWIK